MSRILSTDFADTRVQYLKKNVYDFKLESTKDVTVLLKKLGKALEAKKPATVEVDVTNIQNLCLRFLTNQLPLLSQVQYCL